jgi:hypothetical protein
VQQQKGLVLEVEMEMEMEVEVEAYLVISALKGVCERLWRAERIRVDPMGCREYRRHLLHASEWREAGAFGLTESAEVGCDSH